MKNKRFYKTNYIEGSDILEKNWKPIKKELAKVLLNRKNIRHFQEVDKGQERITSDKKWKTYFLKVYGNYVKKNCQKCPNTTKILRKIPGMYTAMFSILQNDKHIPPHFGPFKGVLRYHLGLIIPKGKKCAIKVGGVTKYWQEGKGMLFDDTYLHEAWNKSNKDRVVLFMDIERPLPYPWLQKINKKIMMFLAGAKRVKDMVKNA